MPVTVTKRFEWDMAHRLGDEYQSKCKHLHGHRYKAEVTCQVGTAGGQDRFDRFGMVVDFGDIKRLCDGWVQEHLDHATLVSTRDNILQSFLATHSQRHYVVPFNTTAENIVQFLAAKFQALLLRRHDGVPITVTHVRLFETPNSFVDWYRDTGPADSTKPLFNDQQGG